MRLMAVAALAAISLTACGKTPNQTAGNRPQAFVADTPQGKTFDNPFGKNSTDTNATQPAPAARTAPDAESGTRDPAPNPAPSITSSTQSVPQVSTPAPSSPSQGFSCNDGKRLCREMTSCEDARFHLQQCGMTRLDGDHDGTPCEKLCS